MDPKDKAKLIKEWNKKLKDAGFEDIEHFDKNGEPQDLMKGNSKFSPGSGFADYVPNEGFGLEYSSTMQYWSKCRELLHVIPFATERDQKIWAGYSEGKPYRAIGKEVGFSVEVVHKTVHKYLKQYF